MDKVYNFDWMVEDIDKSIIFILRDGKENLGSYAVSELRFNVIDDVSVKFANISDLTDFINYTSVRFVDSLNPENIVEIPIRKLCNLYDKSNGIAEGKPKGIRLNEVEAFAINEGKAVSDGYAMYVYSINEESDDLKDIMNIASSFNELSMNDKIEALEDINLINYQRCKQNVPTR